MNSPRAGFTLLQCLLLIVLIALVLGLTMSVVHGPLARRGQQTRVEHLAFSPDGKTLAAGSWNCTLRLGDMTAGRARATYKFSSLAFSPDGKTLATGHDLGTVRLWDVATGRQRTILIGEENQVSWILYGSGFLARALAWWKLKPEKPKSGRVDRTIQVGM
jgi:WD40 repeat protein